MRLLLPLLVACGATPPDVDTADPNSCPDPAGQVDVVVDGLDGTEGIAFSPDGRLFASDLSRVFEVTQDGFIADIATFPHAIGLAWWGDRLMVASFDTGSGVGGVFSLDVDTGVSTLFAEGIANANFLVVTPWDTLLVADDFDTRIFEVSTTGVVTEFLTGVQSPNGMAFSPDDQTLFYVSTFGATAPVWEIPMSGSTPGTPTQRMAYGPGEVPDGMAMTADGNPVIAVNIAGHIDEVSTAGATVLATGVNTPASLAFGEGDWDRCSVYVTSLYGDGISKITTGQPGDVPRR